MTGIEKKIIINSQFFCVPEVRIFTKLDIQITCVK